ncbi:hypothetical protein QYE76_036132 [Lolium multiflorum]|uniref:Uncharacterized protein n=1 Tax=Lolium multiflorum TaxID=4521 RepID=A0AAD8R314_LOLMU|nr:hypothetical protein QYE76_036132 [Lolium multiflorum]
MADEGAIVTTVGDEAKVAVIVAPIDEEAAAVPVVVQPVTSMEKVRSELTAEHSQVENKNHAKRRRALNQWNRDVVATEKRKRAAEQLQLLQASSGHGGLVLP